MAATTRFDLDIPTPGADEDAWGTVLNAYFNSLEAKIFDRLTGDTVSGSLTVNGSTVLQALNATNGTFSGNVTLGDAAADTVTVNGTSTFVNDVFVPTRPFGESSNRAASVNFVNTAMFSATLPAQTGNAEKILSTDGVNAFWEFGYNSQVDYIPDQSLYSILTSLLVKAGMIPNDQPTLFADLGSDAYFA